ncbi:unnamed protein product [Vitrella brassicaformis CCMP3155]|uniref:Uncharacterized protein n=1 Tax=Vitrella brassicaformis (strain CCMP3155) TaxID=1169540 RepID=A0A0G4FWK4_VITBC|nr:unnamed protein product [Vitrella brassicaformis CCMP3155]|eukprot:CEM19301.1 unnamed protein product [Vitrella brassicaformis CCMP3155]
MLRNRHTTFKIMKAFNSTLAAVTQQTTLAITRAAKGPLPDLQVPDVHVKPMSGTVSLHIGNEKCGETNLGDGDFGTAGDGIVTIGQQAVNKVAADKLEVGQSGELLCQAKFNVTDSSGLVVVGGDGSTTVHVAKNGVVFPQTMGPPTYPTTITVTATGYAAMDVGGTTITPKGGGVLSYTGTITGECDLTVVLKTPAMDPVLASLDPSGPAANGHNDASGDDDDDDMDVECGRETAAQRQMDVDEGSAVWYCEVPIRP